jgi:large subunit ribosomal protein L25
VQREINVEALPMEIPEHIDHDVSGMAIGDTLRLADLAERAGVTYLDNPEETVLATVTLPTRVEEPEEVLEEGEEGELPEGEVPPEEQAEGAAEQPAEPGAAAAGESGTSEG